MNLDLVYKWITRPQLVWSATFLLLALLAWQLSVLLWMLVPEPQLQAAEMPLPLKVITDQQQPEITLQQKVAAISRAALFGQVEKKTAAPKPVKQVKEAPKSNLKYKIRGIYYSDDEALASVIIQIDAQNTQFFRLGDEIEPQIYVEEIFPDYILINRNGNLEKLLLEKPTVTASKIQDRHQVSAIRSSPQTTALLKSYKRRYAKNPLALAKRFQAIPVSEGGRNIGYKLNALKGERLLQKLEFEKDDVFVEINGIGLDKPFEALDALKSLTTVDEVTLTVLRNGSRVSREFSLQ